MLARDEASRHLLAPERRIGEYRSVEQLDRDAPGLERPNEPFHATRFRLGGSRGIGRVTCLADVRGDLMQHLLAGHLETERDQVVGRPLPEQDPRGALIGAIGYQPFAERLASLDTEHLRQEVIPCVEVRNLEEEVAQTVNARSHRHLKGKSPSSAHPS